MEKVDILQFIKTSKRAKSIVETHGSIWILINNGSDRKIFMSLKKTTNSGRYEFIYLYYTGKNYILRLSTDKSTYKGKADKYIKKLSLKKEVLKELNVKEVEVKIIPQKK